MEVLAEKFPWDFQERRGVAERTSLIGDRPIRKEADVNLF